MILLFELHGRKIIIREKLSWCKWILLILSKTNNYLNIKEQNEYIYLFLYLIQKNRILFALKPTR